MVVSRMALCLTTKQLYGDVLPPDPFLEVLITESRELQRRNRCFERLPRPDIRRADSSWELVNILSCPFSSLLFTKGTASVSLTAMHIPKWHAVATSTDTICNA